MKCPFCQVENEDRNYYCKWCEKPLKSTGGSRNKKYKDKFKYLLTLNVVEDDSNDRDYFESYNSRKTRN